MEHLPSVSAKNSWQLQSEAISSFSRRALSSRAPYILKELGININGAYTSFNLLGYRERISINGHGPRIFSVEADLPRHIQQTSATTPNYRTQIALLPLSAKGATEIQPPQAPATSPARPAAKECAVDERVPSKDFVPPDITGLSRREAGLVKNRGAAFLSREGYLERLEIRLAELGQVLALAQTSSAAQSDMASEVTSLNMSHESRWFRETNCVASNDKSFCSTRPTSIPDTPVLATHPSSQSRLHPFPTQRLGRNIPPESVAAPGLTDTNDPFSAPFDLIKRRFASPYMKTNQNMEPVDFALQPDRGPGLPMIPLHHYPVYQSTSHHTLSPASEIVVLGSISTGPSSRSPENIPPQPRLEPNSINNNIPPEYEPPFLVDNGDLNSQLKGHAGVELALIALSATVTLTVVCSDKTENHFQACYALGILRPMFLLFHLGAALTTCAILFGNSSIWSGCLRFIWTVFFGLGLCSIVIQVSLYAWTMGNLITRVLTVLIAVLCSLPGFYFVVLKWYPGTPALPQRRDVEG